MNWSRIKCAVLGHKWQVVAGRWPGDITAPADCVRCGEHFAGISWRPRPTLAHGANTNPPPTYTRPAPPPAPPAAHVASHAKLVSAGEEYIESMQSLIHLLSGAREMDKQELIVSASILVSDIASAVNERERAITACLIEARAAG